MNADYYRFQIGDFKCLVLNDGAFTYAPPAFPPPPSFLFLNAPADRLARALNEYGLAAENWNSWTSSYISLLIDTGEQKILVDTGAGSLDAATGKLLQRLEIAGVRPNEIDRVVITHAHPDHVGGNINPAGEAAFPAAGWTISAREWQFWNSDQSEKQLAEHGREMLIDIARRNLQPLTSRVTLVSEEAEIAPGIRVIDAPGHTPGHIALEIKSKGETLLHISDTAIHPLHLANPGWCAAVDVIPDLLPSTRHKIMSIASTGKTLVMASHFPFPGLGYIEPAGSAWAWKPVLSSLAG